MEATKGDGETAHHLLHGCPGGSLFLLLLSAPQRRCPLSCVLPSLTGGIPHGLGSVLPEPTPSLTPKRNRPPFPLSAQVIYSLVSHHCHVRNPLVALQWLNAIAMERPSTAVFCAAAHVLLQARRNRMHETLCSAVAGHGHLLLPQ